MRRRWPRWSGSWPDGPRHHAAIGVAALAGELHVDAADLLLGDGSLQEDVWGANDDPGRGPDDCIAYVSLIDVRPAHGNRSMEVEDPATRGRVCGLTRALIGTGEPRP
jgi:hypothetical protein